MTTIGVVVVLSIIIPLALNRYAPLLMSRWRHGLPLTSVRGAVSPDWLSEYYHALPPPAARQRSYQCPALANWADVTYGLLRLHYPNLRRDEHLELLAQACATDLSAASRITEEQLGFDWAQYRLNAIGAPHGSVAWGWYEAGGASREMLLGMPFSGDRPGLPWDSYYSLFTHCGIGLYYDPTEPRVYSFYILLAWFPDGPASEATPNWLDPDPSLATPQGEVVQEDQSPSAPLSDSTRFNLMEEWAEEWYVPLPRLDGEFGVYGDEQLRCLAYELVSSVNDERQRGGMMTLKRESHMNALAQAHARYLACIGVSGHITLEGIHPYDRLLAVEPPICTMVGECTHCVNFGSDMPQGVVSTWMEDGNRECILDPNATHIGVGVYPDANRSSALHWVVVLAVIPADPATWDWMEPSGVAPTSK